jgi:hypothetical protein
MSFCNRNHFFVVRNEHAQSTTLGPKLMFGVLSRNFVAACHPYRKRVSGCIQSTSLCQRNHFFVFLNEHAKTHVWVGFAKFRCRTLPIPKIGIGCIQTRFLSPEPFLRFSQRTCAIHYFRSKSHVWVGFTQFRCRTSPIPKTGIGCIQTQFLPPESFHRFSQRTCLIHYFRSKTHVWIVSRNFVAARHPYRKRVPGCIQSTSFCHRNHFFVFHNEHAQSTTLGPKLMFGVLSYNFIAARHPFRKRVSGCIQSTSFCHRNHFFVFRNEHAQSTTLGPKLMFGVVSHNFVAARHTFRKRVSECIQSTSFCNRNHFFVFRNEHAQSTTLGPKLLFGVLSRNFVAARHPFQKRVSTKHDFFATGTISLFFATNMPNPLL